MCKFYEKLFLLQELVEVEILKLFKFQLKDN